MRLLVGFLILFFAVTANVMAQFKSESGLTITHIGGELAIDRLDDRAWSKANTIVVDQYWSGKAAPNGRHFSARLLWSKTALYVRFDAVQTEPLVVSLTPDLTKKTVGLWDRDVCEIFIAPDRSKPNKYFEFEIAPTGEWIDLGIEVTPDGRKTDWDYASKLTSAVRVEKDKVVMAIKIPFASLGKTPKPGDVWLGNLFRCVGTGETRGYLAWRPTMTPEPAFHVPSAFGKLQFEKSGKEGKGRKGKE